MVRYRTDQAEERGEMRPRPPELDLKSQTSEAMNEIQQQQGIKAKEEKKIKAAKTDILEEANLSKAEQRKVNWGILKTLVKYIWPKDNIGFRIRVVIALSLLVGAKVLNVQVPFFFKDIIDKLNIDFSQMGTSGSVHATVLTVAGTAILGCIPPNLPADDRWSRASRVNCLSGIAKCNLCKCGSESNPTSRLQYIWSSSLYGSRIPLVSTDRRVISCN
jgi:hypothetical protein